MSAPDLTAEQRVAFDKAIAFLKAKRVERPFFVIDGVAGVGKSVLLAALAHAVPGAALAAPTGKAASVLSRKCGLTVSTVHSLIYLFRGEYIGDDGERRLSFAQKIQNGAWNRRAALIDEASMVDGFLASDLLATGCRVIATGDPGQLPPVRGTRFFDRSDAVLRTVHRQALESPILRQAHAVRAGRHYAADGDAFRVQQHVNREEILAADVILCWRNATRHALNALVRAHKGLDGPPIAGERVVCLRNDHKLGILNGACYDLIEDYDTLRRAAKLRNERGDIVFVEDCRFETLDQPGDPADARDEHPFGFGYALTCHKAQGSEWSSIILVDEYDRQEWRGEWVYTAITRASERMLVHSTWA